jgi:Flp pilus assembly protein TadG
MLRIFNTARRYFCSDAGSIIPIVALLLPLIIGFAGVGVDISSWMMTKRRLQTAADAGALAGAWEMTNGGTVSAAQAAALKEATNNGYDPALAGTLTTTVSTTNGVSTVKTDIHEKVDVWFSSIFIDRTVYADTSASAQTVTAGGFCALALDTSASSAISAGGSASVNSPNCGLAANSSSASSVTLGGSATMHVGAVNLVGSFAPNSGFTYASMHTHAAPIVDPYADLTVPATSCSASAMAHPTSYNSDATLSPGTFCGGVRISGGNTVIALNPGVYVMDGGDFSMTGGSLSGTGVTIILTNSGGSSYGSYASISISGGGAILLKAPTTGTYAGVAVYQDRRAPTDDYNRITGTSGVEIEGAIYTPSNEMRFGGNGRVLSGSSALCTQLIAKTVVFQGNPAMDNNCAGSGTRNIGYPTAKLVL